MRQAIDYWLWEYGRRGFVRWSIEDRGTGEVIGTIELFRREAEDFFTDCGLLRLDLRSDYDTADAVGCILKRIVPETFVWFGCSMIATKAVPAAEERRCALAAMGFVPSPEKVIGHDRTEYGDYWVYTK
ncbi:MAG: N-acetyltransferase, partial [Clostridia bacterium]|nr:N-acetyltransferase [Clostridia bacterium]